MRDTWLYRHLLGLLPAWTVVRAELDVKEERVDCWAEHAEGLLWPCPECGREGPLHDHAEERIWRHLDSCQFKTFLHARPPRVRCPEHGARQVRLPWAEPYARFTMLFERLAIDVLRETDVAGACRILRISWDEAWHIMERAVARGHRYVTVVCDLESSTVEYVGEGRNGSSGAGTSGPRIRDCLRSSRWRG